MSKTSSALVFFALLAAATLGLYLPGLDHALVFDDNRLTDGTIFGGYGSLLTFRPRMLSYGSFVWIQSLFGEGWWKQRLVNVLLHLGVAASLYRLFGDLLARTRFSDNDDTNAELAATRVAALRIGVALFALNPVAVYAVAYLVQRSTLMAALFVALACAAWVRGLVTKQAAWFVGALASYVLAVLSKETSFTAAALAVPLYIFVVRPSWQRTLGVIGGALVAVAIAAAVLFKVYGGIVGTVFDETSRLYALQLEQVQPGVSARLFPLSILNQAALFFYYGVLWFIPNVQWMSVDLRPAFPLSFGAFPQVAGAIGFVVALGAAAWALLRRSNLAGYVALCLLFPLLMFFSEFATVWVQDPFVLYRSYLWALAVPGLVALPFLGFKPKVVYPVGVALALVFAGLAFERVQSLKNDFSVWSDAAEKIDLQAPANAVGRWRPFINRGAYYLDREMTDYAVNDFERAEALGEPQGSARFDIGMALQLQKRYGEALTAFAKAESMGFQEAALYFQRGEAQVAMGQFAQAFDSYSKALEKPAAPETVAQTRLRRAEAAAPAQKYDAAIEDFKALLKDKPNDERLIMGLGLAYIGKDDGASAMKVFEPLVVSRPSAKAFYGRGLAYVVSGDKAAGLRDIDQAIALEPGNSIYKNVRAQVAARK